MKTKIILTPDQSAAKEKHLMAVERLAAACVQHKAGMILVNKVQEAQEAEKLARKEREELGV